MVYLTENGLPNGSKKMSKMGKGLSISRVEQFDINRRVIAHSTQRSWKEVPHVSFVYEADITHFWDYFQQKKEKWSKEIRITFNTVLLKGISEALKQSPSLNSLIHYNPYKKAGTQEFSEDINIAIPWMLKNNKMITPIVKQVQNKNLVEIACAIKDLERRIENTDIDAMQYAVSYEESIDELKRFKLSVLKQVLAAKIGKYRLKSPTHSQYKAYKQMDKADKINPDDIFDASVLVSNFGSLFNTQKGFCTLLEIITPQVFVIGLNAIQEKALVVTNPKTGKKNIAARMVLPLTLTFDHRVADYADLIPFQSALERQFQNPQILEEWIN